MSPGPCSVLKETTSWRCTELRYSRLSPPQPTGPSSSLAPDSPSPGTAAMKLTRLLLILVVLCVMVGSISSHRGHWRRGSYAVRRHRGRYAGHRFSIVRFPIIRLRSFCFRYLTKRICVIARSRQIARRYVLTQLFAQILRPKPTTAAPVVTTTAPNATGAATTMAPSTDSAGMITVSNTTEAATAVTDEDDAPW